MVYIAFDILTQVPGYTPKKCQECFMLCQRCDGCLIWIGPHLSMFRGTQYFLSIATFEEMASMGHATDLSLTAGQF